jgi:NitT/TauT family transport system substrate-binding protein
MKMGMLLSIGVVGIITIFLAASFLDGTQNSLENKVRVAYFPNVGHAVPVVGIENGIFSKGIGDKIEIKTKLFDSGPQVIESLFANSVDIAYVGPGPAINGFLKSDQTNIVILSGAASGGASLVVHPNSEINSIKDFSGKRIASPQIGNSQDISLRYALIENGLKSADKGGSVIVLNVANPDIYTLFAKGEIDAAWVPEPWASILVLELGGKRLFYEEDMWPEKQFASVLLIGRSDFIENNPELIDNWIDSNVKTVNWINQNPDETKVIFNNFMKKTLGDSLPDEIISESLDNLEITSDPIEESIYTFAERADSLGYLGRYGYNLDGIFFSANTIKE